MTHTAVFECPQCGNRVWVEYTGEMPTVECGTFSCDHSGRMTIVD
jgi:predicted RNA-binding Zn-ribbon protein involved in translation (DUF1610 family)